MPLVLLVWLVVGNVVSFALFGLDKRRAQQGQMRISEATLLGSAVLTGTLGAWLGMRHFRHKTRKSSFVARMVVASLIDVVVALLLIAALR